MIAMHSRTYFTSPNSRSTQCHFMYTILLIYLLLPSLPCHEHTDAAWKDFEKMILDKENGPTEKTEGSKRNLADEKPRKDNWSHGFVEHDVALPIRLHYESGKPIQHGFHFLRKRQNADDSRHRTRARQRRHAPDITEHDNQLPSVANYSITAFGEIFRLHLIPYAEFISPMFTVDYKGNVTQEIEDTVEDTPRHCFFSGYINSKVEHKAVVSLCGGLFGAFRTSGVDYLIEPVTMNSLLMKEENEEVGTKLHRIYRRSTNTTTRRPEDLCSYSENSGEADQGPTSNSFSHDEVSRVRAARRKRYISYPRNVEVMVTADNEMKNAHGSNLQHYILTLMAIVHHVYRDASIGNQINIIVVRLVIIGDDDIAAGPRVSKNAHECLRNFCSWQAGENDPDDSHPNHHDTAVLVTRKDICRSEHACDTLGLAELGTMCDPLRSCSINEDNGLSTAFTIAHEMGHEFNAPHDNSEKCITTSTKPNEMHVMSPTLDHKSKPWSWSPCSAKYITNFFSYGNGHCLLDDPPQRIFPLPAEEPGQIFDVNQQCTFVYGKGVNHCGFMTTCARLWCVSADRRHGCRTPHMPWADGTKCGYGKWCMKGKCVSEDRETQPVDGGWGQWSKFGECSRSCGGGIRIAQRDCNNPIPKNDGRYCTGKRKKFRSCNWQACPEFSDFRAEQCRSFDWSKQSYSVARDIPSNAEWVPKYTGILLQDRCKLICQIKGDDRYGAAWYVLKPKVINGTPCGSDTHDVCVEGICKRAGCDHILNSRTTLDDCGICGGDSSGCRTVKGVFERSDDEGYNFVVEIPYGSTNIVIEQQSVFREGNDDNNYLAMRDSSGKFILNGNRNIMQFEHTVEKRSDNGIGYNYRFDYSGSDNVVERINSSTAIRENITVWVLSAGSLLPPNIKYRYNIPLPDKITYFWDPYGPWVACNGSCHGYTERKMLCVRAVDEQTVAEHKCHSLNMPRPVTMPCNTHCEIKWRIKGQDCSSRCGMGVIRYQLECIKLTKPTSQSDSIVEIVDEKYCTSPKPMDSTICYGECLTTSWRYGNWSECSRECGGGTQTRNATCNDGNGDDRPPTDCDTRVRLTARMCNVFACPQWVTGDFSKCLTTCGTGVRRRHVWCRGSGGHVLEDRMCNPMKKPPSTVMCYLPPCPTWKYGQWGKCSVSCGGGIAIRPIWCVDYLDRYIDHEKCDEALREMNTEICSIHECLESFVSPSTTSHAPALFKQVILSNGTSMLPKASNSDTRRNDSIDISSKMVRYDAEWRTGLWTDCSATCGTGQRRRYVSCRNIEGREVPPNLCGTQRKPTSHETCTIGPCIGEWRVSEVWSECSVTCGSGTRKKNVWCTIHGQTVREERCDVRSKPSVQSTCDDLRSCDHNGGKLVVSSFPTLPLSTSIYTHTLVTVTSPTTARTGEWLSGRWSECSSSCGNGSRRRSVVCLGNCEGLPVPPAIKLCDTGTCPKWRSGPWSRCSATCNRGTTQRQVHCVMSDGSIAADKLCNVMKKPPLRTLCHVSRCSKRLSPRWRSTQWSACSVTCGRGLKVRRVTCVDPQKRPVSDDLCVSRRRKPMTTRKCRTRGRCPRWHAGRWSDCSVTCGLGNRVRSVECRYRRQAIANEFCGKITEPEHLQACSANPCISHVWVATTWSPCSASCGRGIERRDIKCVRANEITTSSLTPADCDSSEKPSSTRLCHINTCDSDYAWRLGHWSECSVTCGDGVVERQVGCFSRTTGIEQAAALCEANSGQAPAKIATCAQLPCVPTSCRQVMRYHRADGEYVIQVRGRSLQIYCKGMNTPYPAEYISLRSGDENNFSEIYSLTLNESDTCPRNGSRFYDCACMAYPQSGKTVFRKLRFHIRSMKIIMNDFTFANSGHGMPVPYAVAGDCYSKVRCPQGRFRIDLSGTGLVVSRRTKWNSYGRFAEQDIRRFRNGEIVQGKCGGYCGQCRPDPTTGLELMVSEEE